jgi:glucan biosynthesis protein C
MAVQNAVAPAPLPEPQKAPRRREYGLDWLRVIAFVILIAYHTGFYFGPGPWFVKNPTTSPWLAWVMLFFNRWRLPLLFFISGAGTWFNLRRRGYGSFALERIRRLLVPLAFGMFVVVPPQVYIERVLAGAHYSSYFEFWGTVFHFVPYPMGNFAWLHLWFLPYILIYSLAGIPLFALLRAPAGRTFVARLARSCELPGFIYLLPIPGIAAAILLEPHWPSVLDFIHDWANVTVSFLMFLWGFIICGSEPFLNLIERRRYEFTWVAALIVWLVYAVRIDPAYTALSFLIPGLPGNLEARRCLTDVVDGYFAMFTILALVGWSRNKLNHDSAGLRWANAAVYPFYIAHETVTVLLGYAWRHWDTLFLLKFCLLFAGTFLGSWLIYESMRHTRVTRMLFGMKD